MSGLVSRIRKRYQTTLETFIVKFEHLSAQLVVEQARFRHVQLQLPAHLSSSRSRSVDRRGYRSELDPATEHHLSVAESLLSSLQAIHQKYSLSSESPYPDGRQHHDVPPPRLHASSKFACPSTSPSTSFHSRVELYRERMSPKELIAWVVTDAREFEEKIARVGCALDDVEDLVRAIKDSRGVMKLEKSGSQSASQSPPQSQLSTSIASSPGSPPPPPYSAVDPAVGRAAPRSHLEPSRTRPLPRPSYSPHPHHPPPPPPPPLPPQIPLPSPPSHHPSLSHHNPTSLDTLQQPQYLALKSHLLTSLLHRGHAPPNALIASSLSHISTPHLRDLRTDVHDELIRRRVVAFAYSPPSPLSSSSSRPLISTSSSILPSPSSLLPTSLPTCICLPPSRRQARHIISLLPPRHFGDLISDLVLEHERRFPGLKRLQSVVPLASPYVADTALYAVVEAEETAGRGRGRGRGRCACACGNAGGREEEEEGWEVQRRRSRSRERVITGVVDRSENRRAEDISTPSREEPEEPEEHPNVAPSLPSSLSLFTPIPRLPTPTSRWSYKRGTWSVDIPTWISGTTSTLPRTAPGAREAGLGIVC